MKYSLSPAEEEILTVLWENKKWTTCSELVSHFHKQGKDWKRQTVNTFLSRLLEKGFVVKNGRSYIYNFTKEEFDSLKAKELVETFYSGSVKNFMSALTGKNRLEPKYVNELKEYLDGITENE